MTVIKKTISIQPAIFQAISSRMTTSSDRSALINRDLKRLYDLYALSRKELSKLFDHNELIFLLLANQQSQHDVQTASVLEYLLNDAFTLQSVEPSLKIDKKSFLQKIATLNRAQKLALIDACERYWCEQESIESSEIILSYFE